MLIGWVSCSDGSRTVRDSTDIGVAIAGLSLSFAWASTTLGFLGAGLRIGGETPIGDWQGFPGVVANTDDLFEVSPGLAD